MIRHYHIRQQLITFIIPKIKSFHDDIAHSGVLE